MKNSKVLIFIIILGFTFTFCSSPYYIKNDKGQINIIPKPKEVILNNGFFVLNDSTKIVADINNEEINFISNYLSSILKPSTGYKFKIVKNDIPANKIKLNIDSSIQGPKGIYCLDVNKKGILISAPEPVGLFYGIQSLRQLIPPEIEMKEVHNVEWKVPLVKISDEPAFKYRGMMLDVSRHFFPVSFIKKYLDLMALYKMNTFHWHLTDDQGWRIEIKKYPKLTEIGSIRKETLVGHLRLNKEEKYDGVKYGGYYTQEDIKDIVSYAKTRYITIIPEIEMPGHSLAALASYPELGCTGGPYEVATKWGICDDVYCAGNEEVFTFLENVLTEVMALFPSEYIHIGGDECPKTKWKKCSKCQARIKCEGLKDEHELQSYFIRRIEKFLNSHGRQIIGWDEILEGGLAPKATVMSWRNEKGGIKAAKMHHDLIMTPVQYLYFDYYQDDPKTQPLAIGGFLTTKKVYSYYPVPGELNSAEAKYVLGAQGNVWTEYLKDSDNVEYMTFPRACALSEVVWTPNDSKNWNDFTHRMKNQFKRLDALEVNYFKGNMDAKRSK